MQGLGYESLFQGQNLARGSGQSVSDILARIGGSSSSDTLASASPVAATQTANAVAAASDSTNISAQAQSFSDLQAIIERLNSANSGDVLGEVLEDLQGFVSNNTSAGASSGVLSELNDLADTILQEASSGGTAFDSGFEFAFAANYSQTTIDNGNFYRNETDFSFSFSFRTDDTVLTGSGDFSENLSISGNEYRFESNENVSVGLVTFDTDITENPALSAFNEIASRLSNITPESLLADNAPSAIEAFAARLVPPYQPATLFDNLRARLEVVGDTLGNIEELLERLSERLNPTEADSAPIIEDALAA